MKLLKLTIVISLFFLLTTNAQKSSTILNSEIAVLVGPTFMQTDYGGSNSGIDFGVAYIADFSESKYENSGFFTWLADHTKTRLEISFSNVDLEFDSDFTESGTEAAKFRGMTGNVKQFNVGIFGEWYFKSLLQNYNSKFQPYFLTGISSTSADVSIDVGNAGLPSIYNDNNLFVGNNSAISFTYGLGARVKIDNNFDIIAEGRFQPFLSDEIDGIDTDIAGDDSEDTQSIFKIGAVYRFN
jgi:opacity protein-like surface antigen